MKEQEMKQRLNELSMSKDPKDERIVRALTELYVSYFDFNGRSQLSAETRGVVVWNAIDDILTALEANQKIDNLLNVNPTEDSYKNEFEY